MSGRGLTNEPSADSLRAASSAWASLPRASRKDRLLAGGVAVAAWAVLAVAAALTPRACGYGTHEAMGLPACHFKIITGYPCPSCGMTTAFAAFVRGDLIAAVRAQVFGAVLAAATLLAALGGTVTALAGVSFSPLLSRVFLGRLEWFYLLVGLAVGSWALKAWIGS